VVGHARCLMVRQVKPLMAAIVYGLGHLKAMLTVLDPIKLKVIGEATLTHQIIFPAVSGSVSVISLNGINYELLGQNKKSFNTEKQRTNS
jgi:hypothetical protein